MNLTEQYVFDTLKSKLIKNENGKKHSLCLYIALYHIIPEEDLCSKYGFNCHECAKYILEKVDLENMLKEFLKLKKDSLSALAKSLEYCKYCRFESSKRCKECVLKEKIHNTLLTLLKNNKER